MAGLRPEDWLKATDRGLWCAPADLYIDPVRAVGRAVVTHGHADHARPGNGRVTAMASGGRAGATAHLWRGRIWMRVRQRARQRGVELPLIISDHADWDELTATLDDVGAPEVWVTHGREEALVHWAAKRGIRARALSLIGREDEDE